MKIGILTLFHKNYNWGGVLQGYALKTYLETHFEGVEAKLLQYHSATNVVYGSRLQQALQYGPVDIVKKVSSRVLKKKWPEGADLSGRYANFDRFMENYQEDSMIYTDSNLHMAADEYDLLICGSDQIWNPNVARPGYFLKDIGGVCRKAAYAASIARDDLSEHEKEVMLPLIRAFDFVSVREKTAKDFLNRDFGEEIVSEVLDPALMLTKEEWAQIASDELVPEKKYALAFFFSESEAYRREAAAFCSAQGMELLFIPLAKGELIASDLLGDGRPVWDVGPEAFVGLFRNAEAVFTDSFHGAVFSLLFGKNFCVFERDAKGKTSKNSRLYDLLDKFELSDRLVREGMALADVMAAPTLPPKTEMLLEKYRASSHAFLLKTLSGMEAKGSACPIELKGKGLEILNRETEAYIGYNRKESIRRKSSSGGLFYELAYAVLIRKGAVYGAAFDEKKQVKHRRITRISELPALLGSKYVQSDLTAVYRDLKQDVLEKRKLLFAGTPCQVAAVKTFLKTAGLSPENVLFVDFICHGVPAPGTWRSYLEYMGGASQINRVNFRDKSHGWHDYFMSIEKESGERLACSHEMDPFMRSFLSDKNIRPSCYACLFKDRSYASDITLGDAWKIEKEQYDWADDKGTSLFVIRSAKGRAAILDLPDHFVYQKSDYNSWCYRNPSLAAPTECPGDRQDFFGDFAVMTPEDFWEKYRPVTGKAKVRYQVKQMLRKSGLEKAIRKRI